MLSHRSIIASLVLIVVLPACRKDHIMDLPGGTVDCVPTPPPGSLLGWNFLVPQHALKGACFNPNDGDEIIFIDRLYGGSTTFLFKYRISSGQLAEIPIGSGDAPWILDVDWGNNGWVLLNLWTSGGRNIFKVKDNGDSLTQLTFSDWNFAPIWSPDASKWAYHNNAEGPSTSMICSTDDGSCDEFGRRVEGWACWYSDTCITTMLGMYDTYGLFNWNIATDTHQMLYDIPPNPANMGGPYGLTVLPDGRTALWLQTIGLYKTDLITGATAQVMGRTCNSQYFVGLDHSPQTNKLVTTRITRTPVNENDLQIGIDIMLMNPDGTDQQVLNIPFPE